MPELIGFTGIAVVSLITLILALYWPPVGTVLMVGLAVRIAAILLHHFVVPLPDSGADSASFERLAWTWAQGGFIEALGHYPGPDSSFISWILAVLYSVTGRSVLMGQSVSLLFGIGTVFLGWLLARKVWDDSVAAKASWVLALFPTLILYSALIMREAYVCFFFLIALHGVVRWARSGCIAPAILAVVGFVGATFFHGAMIVGAFMFSLVFGLNELARAQKALLRGRLIVLSVVLLSVGALGVTNFVSTDISLPKLGTINQLMDIERTVSAIASATRGSDGEVGASYPEWTVPNSVMEVFYKAPIRAVYFIFSPFPWDVRSARHLIGLFDGFLYMALMFLVWRNRKIIWADRASRILLLILGSYVLVFGLAVGNFGTGIRHRAKFVAALVVLAAPLIPKLVLCQRQSCETRAAINIKDS